MQEKTSIFRGAFTLENINAHAQGTLAETLGISVTEVGPDYLVATMPVDSRSHQPMGILHGGASVALAETVGSVAANGTLDQERQYAVGLEINANHLRSVRNGNVIAIARPVHIGRSTQVWDIRLSDEAGKPVCISRLTIAVLDK